ncbi:helix-turn-helix domain-containing protein [Photobacterium piscicola]|jgi:putative transcriptional regulator|uniref:helix-turn-helix domain-containing protein n=1 Tax=Photobacterium TaxID=657 RepID=UPI0037370801
MSDILNMVHDTASELCDAGAISKVTMREFDALCLTPVSVFTGQDVQALRLRYQLSQSVLASYLNVSTKLVQKWEQNDSHPRGAAQKLLALANRKGIDAIA